MWSPVVISLPGRSVNIKICGTCNGCGWIGGYYANNFFSLWIFMIIEVLSSTINLLTNSMYRASDKFAVVYPFSNLTSPKHELGWDELWQWHEGWTH